MIQKYLIVIAYLSLLIELVFFPVKSNASTYRLLKSGEINVFFKQVLTLASNSIIIGVYLLPILNLQLDWWTWNEGIYFMMASFTIIVLGRWLSFGAMWQLIKSKGGSHLQTTSFFKFTRNPNVDGSLLFLIGICILMPSVIFALGIIYSYLYYRSRIKMEESFLIDHFGKEYLTYQYNTRRFLYLW